MSDVDRIYANQDALRSHLELMEFRRDGNKPMEEHIQSALTARYMCQRVIADIEGVIAKGLDNAPDWADYVSEQRKEIAEKCGLKAISLASETRGPNG